MRWPAAFGIGVGALAAGAVVLLLRGVSLPFLVPFIEREAAAALGRSLTVGEAPWIRLGRSTQLRVNAVQLANTPADAPQPLAALNSAEVRVDLFSLLRPPLRIERLVIDGLVVALATDADGISNLPRLAARDTEEAPQVGTTDAVGFVLGDVRISDVHLSHTDARSGEQHTLVIDGLTQLSPDPRRLQLKGSGRVQGRRWMLSGEHSGLASIMAGRDLWGTLEGRLGELQLSGDYRLADRSRLADLHLTLALTGVVSPELAGLSPLLEADKRIAADLRIVDVDPGIALDAVLDLGTTQMQIHGIADDPGDGDGLDLSLDVDIGDLNRVTAALALGPAEHSELRLDARVTRQGRRIEVSDIDAVVGPHRISGRVLLPFAPGTTDARVDLRAEGPEFAFYQRLFKRPFEVNAPYELELLLAQGERDRERVRARVELGRSVLRVQGELGDFPRYRDSTLRLQFAGADLAEVGSAFEIALPAGPVDLDARLDVAADGVIDVQELLAHAFGSELRAEGSLNGYPDLDDIDLRVALQAPSLQDSLRALDLTLQSGEVPARLNARVTGSLERLSLHDLQADVGASRLLSTDGALTLEAGVLRSDATISAQFDGLREILGPSAPERYEGRPFSLVARIDVSPEGYGVRVTDLEGEHLRGQGEFFIGPELAVDERLHIGARIDLEAPSAYLPRVAGYTPPASPLRMSIGAGGTLREYHGTISSAGRDLLEGTLITGDGKSPARFQLSGGGPDLRGLGALDVYPTGDLAYELDLGGSFDRTSLALEIANLDIAGTQLRGSVAVAGGETPTIRAELEVPRGRLDDWIRRNDPAPSPPAVVERSGDGRLIPDIALPLDRLAAYSLELGLRTGPLGLSDPGFPDMSLVDRSELHWQSDAEGATLFIENLVGSRGTWSLDARARPDGDGALLELDANARDLPFGLLTETGDSTGLPVYTLDATLSARGQGTRDLAASLTGELLMTGGAGTLPRLGIGLATDSFLQQIADVLLPDLAGERRSPRAECSILGVRARDGVLTLDPGFVSRTERVDLSARGAINLTTERLAIRFDNQARKGLGISAASLVNPYFQVTGTLARPRLSLDVAGSALAGGAAVASGGLTVLARPLLGRFLRRRSPCDVALKRWEDTAEPAPQP